MEDIFKAKCWELNLSVYGPHDLSSVSHGEENWGQKCRWFQDVKEWDLLYFPVSAFIPLYTESSHGLWSSTLHEDMSESQWKTHIMKKKVCIDFFQRKYLYQRTFLLVLFTHEACDVLHIISLPLNSVTSIICSWIIYFSGTTLCWVLLQT